ncbi:unnamed protein product, partial [Iphiclides podalirius]
MTPGRLGERRVRPKARAVSLRINHKCLSDIKFVLRGSLWWRPVFRYGLKLAEMMKDGSNHKLRLSHIDRQSLWTNYLVRQAVAKHMYIGPTRKPFANKTIRRQPIEGRQTSHNGNLSEIAVVNQTGTKRACGGTIRLFTRRNKNVLTLAGLNNGSQLNGAVIRVITMIAH